MLIWMFNERDSLTSRLSPKSWYAVKITQLITLNCELDIVDTYDMLRIKRNKKKCLHRRISIVK